jgi:type I restriction enzyme S subunit
VEHGELLFAWSGTPGTSFGAHIWRGPTAALNQHIYRVLFSEEVLDKRFLRLAINQQLDGLINAAHGGAGLAHVTKYIFEDTPITFPPLLAQKRIVRRVEALLAQVNATRECLTRIHKVLNRFRQSVLVAACSGRLTEEWRGRHAHHPLTPDALIAARRRAWIRAEAARRRREGRPIREADLFNRYVAPQEAAARSDAPDSWLWTTLDQIPCCRAV